MAGVVAALGSSGVGVVTGALGSWDCPGVGLDCGRGGVGSSNPGGSRDSRSALRQHTGMAMASALRPSSLLGQVIRIPALSAQLVGRDDWTDQAHPAFLAALPPGKAARSQPVLGKFVEVPAVCCSALCAGHRRLRCWAGQCRGAIDAGTIPACVCVQP